MNHKNNKSVTLSEIFYLKYVIRKEAYMNKEKKHSNKCPICGRSTHKKSEYCIFHAGAEEKTEREFIEALKKYIQEIKEKDKNYDFKYFIFIGYINFRKDMNTTNFKDADFDGTNFEGDANFERGEFKGDADFKGATFKRNAFFRDVTFKGDALFKGAIFQRYADFKRTTFKGNAFFRDVTFERDASFVGATFQGSTFFRDAIFEYCAGFGEATFERNTFFKGATFEKYAGFWWAIFKGDTVFEEVTFKEIAFFRDVTFKGDALFAGATFEGSTYFQKATFKEIAEFCKAIFKGEVSFQESNFEREAGFQGATFKRETSFDGAFLPPGKNFSLKVKKGGSISFEKTYLEGVLLKLNIDEDVLINFNKTKLINTKIRREDIVGHLLHEQKKEFCQAIEVYKILKNNFRSLGNYQEEKWAFLKEKEMERRSYSYEVFKKENE